MCPMWTCLEPHFAHWAASPERAGVGHGSAVPAQGTESSISQGIWGELTCFKFKPTHLIHLGWGCQQGAAQLKLCDPPRASAAPNPLQEAPLIRPSSPWASAMTSKVTAVVFISPNPAWLGEVAESLFPHSRS